MPADDEMLSQRQFADWFDQHPTTMAEWLDAAGVKRDSKSGKYPFQKSIRELVKGTKARLGNRPPVAAGADLTASRAQLAKSQTQQIEMKMALQSGEFVRYSTLEQFINERDAMFREKLLGLPGQMQAEIGVDGVEEKVRKGVYASLNELTSPDLFNWAEDDEPTALAGRDAKETKPGAASGSGPDRVGRHVSPRKSKRKPRKVAH